MALPSSLDLHLKHLRAVPPCSRGPSRCSPSCQPSSRPPHTCQTSPRAHSSSRAARHRNAFAFPNVLTEKLHRRRTAYRRLGGKPTPSQNCSQCQETPGRAPNSSSPSPTAWLGARVVLVTSLPLTSQPLCLPPARPGTSTALVFGHRGLPRHSRHPTCHLLVQHMWVKRQWSGPAAPSQPSRAASPCSRSHAEPAQHCHSRRALPASSSLRTSQNRKKETLSFFGVIQSHSQSVIGVRSCISFRGRSES